MRFAVGEATFLVVAMPQEWLLAFGTHKVLNMPIFAQCSDDSLLDRTTACATNGNAHLIVTSQAIQFVHVIGCETWTTLDFTSGRIQLHIASGTIEMIPVIDFTAET